MAIAIRFFMFAPPPALPSDCTGPEQLPMTQGPGLTVLAGMWSEPWIFSVTQRTTQRRILETQPWARSSCKNIDKAISVWPIE